MVHFIDEKDIVTYVDFGGGGGGGVTFHPEAQQKSNISIKKQKKYLEIL